MLLTRRALAPGALALAAIATATGCTATNPQSTLAVSNPADGTDLTLGTLSVGNLLVVTDDKGLGTLVARLVNSAHSAASVTLTDQSGSGLDQTFSVPADGTLAVGPDQDRSVSLPHVGVAPGGTLQVRVAVAGGASQSVPVPVLDGSQPIYRTLVPTPAVTPTPAAATPTGSTSPSSSGASTGAAAKATPTRASTAQVTSAPQRSADASPSGSPTG